jgi:hypothetical protein
MLSHNERRVLEEIERDLHDSDSDLAEGLRTFTPVRRGLGDRLLRLRPRVACLAGRRMLLVAAVLSLLIGVVGVLLSRLAVGLAAFTMATVAASAYLVAVMGDFARDRDSSR